MALLQGPAIPDSAASDAGAAKHAVQRQCGTAMFFAFSSVTLVCVNKEVLSTYEFPSVRTLAFCQFAATVAVTACLHTSRVIQVQRLSADNIWPVLALASVFVVNVISGLGSTQHISIPMYTALRQLATIATMVLEQCLGMSAPSCAVHLCVGMMLGGALVAALSDLSMDGVGYTLIMVNNICSALYGVLVKRVLNSGMSKASLLFYNAAFGGVSMVSQLLQGMMLANERQEVEDAVAFIRMASSGLDFMIFFAMATCMGMVLNYSVYLCTATNSALTTAMVGSVKNMLAAYVGMAFSDDYVFRLHNIIGIHITILGASCYTYVKYRETTAA
ncbi:hypothetical protein JKP88DRAFT_163711 [Tribonema minus]|uniref:Sugar phosphate transporter domain-containing protein n=1 Tax=Tribonema minus TaxID=303371 RepID=A0A835YYG2_9STRA|nr:hypothetical protein JKP88DRAFT_163711 [Tribonema minus]